MRGPKKTSDFTGAELAVALAVCTIIILAVSAGSVCILMLAWNAIVPWAVGGPTITFGKALALYVLLGLIGGALGRK